MAKIVEQLGVVKVSKLVKESESDELDMLNDEVQESIVGVLEELLGDGVVVEVEVGE